MCYGEIVWAGTNLNVMVGKHLFDKTYSFWGYQCFPILNDENNKKHPAKWLFEKNDGNDTIHHIENNGYPILFIHENEINFNKGI